MSRFSPIPFVPPKAQSWNETTFPYAFALDPKDSCGVGECMDWVASKRQELMDLASLHGAVLFRGFPLVNAEDFDRLVSTLEIENFPYKRSLSNAVRVNFTERVFSANEAPSTVKIFLHHEMAQTPLYPAVILFFCELAAEQGGATPLCRSDVLYEKVAEVCPNLIRDLAMKGLKYSNVMPAADDPESGMGRSWQSTLGVSDRDAAEKRLHELGYSWEWLEQDSLRATTPILPGVRKLPDGRVTLFNQLIAAYSGWKDKRNDPSSAIRHGDDTPLDAASVNRLIEIADEITFDMEWQTGDAVLIDNTLVMHGRRPFVGKRRVLASLGQMGTHAFQLA